ncbi:MAG TPA: SAM-dependent methyltransferase [Bacteroidetes bacterium]|nr:SAM-dependent methyltransferase [Bacteroidota bacterium]
MPGLYLIPTPIAEPFVLPEYLKEIRCFVVENLREARRFLKWNFKDLDIDACLFLEINKNALDINEIHVFMKNAMAQNSDVGLLSDAGVPCVADPGAVVVEKAHELGFTVHPLVGPSSLLLALMASGFNGQCFAFHGYLPIPENEQIKKIKSLEEESSKRDMSQLFIETPYRNTKILQQLLATLNPATRLCVACDLGAATQEIISKKVRDWKPEKYNFHKRPAVFLIYAR